MSQCGGLPIHQRLARLQLPFIIHLDGKDEAASGFFWLIRVAVMQEGRKNQDFGRRCGGNGRFREGLSEESVGLRWDWLRDYVAVLCRGLFRLRVTDQSVCNK